MRFQTPLVPATLIRRYKRFLADIRLEDGREVLAHCPNPGAMTGLAQPGARIWVEPNDDPKKKLKFGWRLVEGGGGQFSCIDTSQANRVVGEALHGREIPELGFYENIRPEQKYGEKSRIDFLLEGSHPNIFLEVKSVTLMRRTGLAEFPDSVTARGARHLDELAWVAVTGQRAVLYYLIQRTDCTSVSVARDIDPTYASALDAAIAAGVEVLAYGACIGPTGINLGPRMDVVL